MEGRVLVHKDEDGGVDGASERIHYHEKVRSILLIVAHIQVDCREGGLRRLILLNLGVAIHNHHQEEEPDEQGRDDEEEKGDDPRDLLEVVILVNFRLEVEQDANEVLKEGEQDEAEGGIQGLLGGCHDRHVGPSVHHGLGPVDGIATVHALGEGVNQDHDDEKGGERGQIQQERGRLVAILLKYGVKAVLGATDSELVRQEVIQGDKFEAENSGHCREEDSGAATQGHIDQRQVGDKDQAIIAGPNRQSVSIDVQGPEKANYEE